MDQPTTKAKKTQLGHEAFFALASWVRENEGAVLALETYAKVAEAASAALKFPISPHSIPNALKATGLFEKFRRAGKAPEFDARAATKVLAYAVINLYMGAKRDVPPELEELVKEL